MDNLRIFWRDALAPLEDYDQNSGTNYVGILREYLESNSSIQEVAFKKNVHRNTVNYQIKKIKEILNCEFDSEEKITLLLAYYIKDLLDT